MGLSTMDGHKHGSSRGRSSRQLWVEILEDKLLFSVSVALGSFAALHQIPAVTARIAVQAGAESTQALLTLQSIPTTHGALTRQSHEGIPALSDPEGHLLDRDDDDAIPENSERHESAMLEAMSNAAMWTRPVTEMEAEENGEANEGFFGEPMQERLVQALSLDAIQRAPVLASAVNASGALVPVGFARRPPVPDELPRIGAALPSAEILSNAIELVGPRLAGEPPASQP